MLFVVYVLFGFLSFALYLPFRWKYVENADFRLTHTICIVFVATESILQIPCPLTILEWWLAMSEYNGLTPESFMGRLFYRLLYYRAEEYVFTTAYALLAVIGVYSLFKIPLNKKLSQTLTWRIMKRPATLLLLGVLLYIWLDSYFSIKALL